MNKKLTIIISIAALFISCYAIFNSTSNSLKVAYVDTAVLLNKYEGMQEIQDKMERRKKEW